MSEAKVQAAASSTEAANRRTARRLVKDVLNARRLDGWDELFAAVLVSHLPGLPPDAGRDSLRGHAEVLLAAFPDLRYDIEAEVAQGDEVVLRLRATGTHVGELFGAARSGQRIQWEEMHVFRFDAGARIVEHWGLLDFAAMMMQLGLIPPVERW
jgi:predicted ester cyclase